MTFEEAVEAFEKLDIRDPKSFGRVYDRHFQDKLDKRFFLFQSDPISKSEEIIEAVLSNKPIDLQFLNGEVEY